jgi:CCR4-NOT transcription complex subunit 9
MESGSELSKTVATFIVQKILLDNDGLKYICAAPDRFFAVTTVLHNMVMHLVNNPSARLLKHVVRCYLRLSDNESACEALVTHVPAPLLDNTFLKVMREDQQIAGFIQRLDFQIKHFNSNQGGAAVPMR